MAQRWRVVPGRACVRDLLGSGRRADASPRWGRSGLDRSDGERDPGVRRPFPQVRSGASIPGVADRERPSLILLVAWKGVGSAELELAPLRDWRFASSLVEDGAGTLEANTESLPLDPAATLTTIGTCGLC